MRGEGRQDINAELSWEWRQHAAAGRSQQECKSRLPSLLHEAAVACCLLQATDARNGRYGGVAITISASE